MIEYGEYIEFGSNVNDSKILYHMEGLFTKKEITDIRTFLFTLVKKREDNKLKGALSISKPQQGGELSLK